MPMLSWIAADYTPCRTINGEGKQDNGVGHFGGRKKRRLATFGGNESKKEACVSVWDGACREP